MKSATVILGALVGLALVLVTSTAAIATSYSMSWSVICSAGGEGTSFSYGSKATVGQYAPGYVETSTYRHWIGFWVKDPVLTHGISVPMIREAKLLPDGVRITLPGKIATSSSTDFSDVFYVEEPDRSSGVRISVESFPTPFPRGNYLDIVGDTGTTLTGERQLENPVVTVFTGQISELAPLGLNNRSLGGGNYGSPPLGQLGVTGGTGLNNVGLLVKTWGIVTEVGSDYLIINDGSAVITYVSTAGLPDLPGLDQFVTVAGISSLYKVGPSTYRRVIPRDRADILP